jgi:uncharacterized membrane protein YidH (DUF202 family)
MLSMFSKADSAQVGITKVEPKTLFAAERTFCLGLVPLFSFQAMISIFKQFWFGVSIVVSNDSYQSRIHGLSMIICGIGFIFYAMHNFIRRCNALMRKQPTGYLDLWGPVILGMITVGFFWDCYFLLKFIP